jgi:hypothetical protein
MATPTEDQIKDFLHGHIEAWNDGDRAAFERLYRSFAGQRLTMEYVGRPLVDGWVAFESLWTRSSGRFRVEVVTQIVAGNEAACHYENIEIATGHAVTSIEFYRFGDRTLDIRYFHKHDQMPQGVSV